MTKLHPMFSSSFFRFLLSGGLNTLITYGIYLVLLVILPYQLSYTLAYVSGIFISYGLNRAFVFRSHNGLSSVLLFPLVYLVQYCAGILVLWVSVAKLGIDEVIAPVIVIIVTVPLTFVLTRFVFLGRTGSETVKQHK